MPFESIPPLSSLVGSQLTQVTAREFDWAFDFSGGIGIVAESSHWRLLGLERVIVTDEDHRQSFGHKEPIDASTVVLAELRGASIDRAELSPVSDLLLSFNNGRALQLLVSSAGYENWHVYGPDKSHAFAIGGGELCREETSVR